MKINLYKIDSKDIDELTKKLKKYELVDSLEIDDTSFYLFINRKKRKRKQWIEELSKIFDLSKGKFNFGEIYNGILIIDFENKLFGIPFGYAFHRLREICDPEFAMNFAEIQLDPSNIELKGSFFVQSMRIKELVSYKAGSRIRYDLGESFYFVSGKPKDSYFGNKVKCGFSINFSKEFALENKCSLEKISEFVKKVDSVLKEPKEFKFPRIYTYKKSNPITEKLDNILLEKLKIDDLENVEIVIDSLPMFLKYGILPTNERGTIRYNKIFETYDEFTLENICEFLRENDIRDLSNVKITFGEQETEKSEIKLKDILLVHLEDNGERYVLNEGFWGKYNESFIKLLEEKLNEISNENMKLNEFGIDSFSNEDEYINTIISKFPNSIKLHKVFLNFSGNNTKASNIELADLYKNGELITVKLGKNNSDFCYAFDQAYQGIICLIKGNITVLSEQLAKKLTGLAPNRIGEILSVKTYAILFGFEQKLYLEKIKNNIFNLNSLGSFILKLKIVWWDDFMRFSDLNYKIYVEGVRKIS
jgi:uncharacterized protein (TIGR04141 family)